MWRKKRKWTVINGYLCSFSHVLALTVYYPTEYYYFKDTMQVENPHLFFGLGYGCLYGAAVVSSLVGSYYADKTKRLREILLVTSAINLIGNVLYLLHSSPYIVLVGQFLIGISFVRKPAITGELARVFEKEEITRIFSLIILFSNLGFVLGPCFTLMFQMVSVRVGWWTLDVNNMSGGSSISLASYS